MCIVQLSLDKPTVVTHITHHHASYRPSYTSHASVIYPPCYPRLEVYQNAHYLKPNKSIITYSVHLDLKYCGLLDSVHS